MNVFVIDLCSDENFPKISAGTLSL